MTLPVGVCSGGASPVRAGPPVRAGGVTWDGLRADAQRLKLVRRAAAPGATLQMLIAADPSPFFRNKTCFPWAFLRQKIGAKLLVRPSSRLIPKACNTYHTIV